MTPELEIWGIHGIPEVHAGDDIAGLMIAAGADLRDGDVVVVTSKVVSKAEGRLVTGNRDDYLASETVRVVARRGHTQIVTTRHGLVLAAGGIDGSNVPIGTVALLPVDPDASAQAIRSGLRQQLGVDVAVIVTDTMGRPWRDGVVDAAIGAAGLEVLEDFRGQVDSFGHVLEVTVTAIGDELAAAADLVKGKLSATPVAVVRGFAVRRPEPDQGATPLVRGAEDDLFFLGARDAMAAVVRDSAPVDQPGAGGSDPAAVRRALDGIGPAEARLAASEDGRIVTATGSPLAVGYALGRLAAALAAEGLRATAPEVLEGADGAAVHVGRVS